MDHLFSGSLYGTHGAMVSAIVDSWLTAGECNDPLQVSAILDGSTDEEIVGDLLATWTVSASREDLLLEVAAYRSHQQ
jgi:hypothetical protein